MRKISAPSCFQKLQISRHTLKSWFSKFNLGTSCTLDKITKEKPAPNGTDFAHFWDYCDGGCCYIYLFLQCEIEKIIHLLVTETDNKPKLIEKLKSASDVCYYIMSIGLAEVRRILNSSAINQEVAIFKLL